MFKILIADDERIIREGISQIVPWKALDLELVDIAVNGNDAFQKIKEKNPDILITDIKMPGLSGLELIEKVIVENKNIKIIILSGYGEFDFAKKAMKFGVKHYLLKPTNEDEIKEVLTQVISEVKELKEKDDFIDSVKKDIDNMLPLAKEQFVRDRILNKIYSKDELNYYKKIFNLIDNEQIKLILFELEEGFEVEEMVAIEKILKKNLKEFFLVNTFIKNTLIVLIKIIEETVLIETIRCIKKTFNEFYKKELSVSLSKSDTFNNLHILYQEAKEILKYKFYLGEGTLIRNEDVKESKDYKILKDYNFIIEQIAISVKCGDRKAVINDIEDFIKDLKVQKLEKDIIVSYSMELLLSIVRNNFENIKENFDKDINDYFGRIINFQKLKNINEIEENIKKIALEITDANYTTFKHKRNRLIELILQKIEENLDNVKLSLKWLSTNIVFANVDYLSKLFKKEMGKNFSHYLVELRMEKAKKLLKNVTDDKIYEVALKVGFGYNSQYFSQVFKNQTGLSPTEYRKKLLDEKE